MLDKALLSRMSQKTYHTRYEKIILDRIRCEKAPQVVRACLGTQKMCHIKGNVCAHVTSDVTTVSRSRLSGRQRQFQKVQLLIKFFAFQVIYKKTMMSCNTSYNSSYLKWWLLNVIDWLVPEVHEQNEKDHKQFQFQYQFNLLLKWKTSQSILVRRMPNLIQILRQCPACT